MTARYEHDDIARIAYRSWLDRGQPQGSPEVDWYYALSVVTNPDEIRPLPFGESTDASIDDSRNGFASHAAPGVDGGSMQDDAEQLGKRSESASDAPQPPARQSSRSGTRSGRRATDKLQAK